MKYKFCSYCGNEIKGAVKYCPHCGKELFADSLSSEKASNWWGVLGFFYPVVGLILYLVFAKERPGVSKKAGTGALISVLTYVFFMTIVMIFALIFTFTDDEYSKKDNWNDFPNRNQEVYGEDDWT